MVTVEENYRSFRPSLEAGGNVTKASEQLSDELAATEVKFLTALIAFLPAALVLIV
jgi:hypothetical protein